jgi:hypothetical protein
VTADSQNRGPKLTIRGRRQRVRHRSLTVRVSCPSFCRVRAFSPAATSRVTQFIEAGRTGRIALHLQRRARRAIAAAHRRGEEPVVTVQLIVRAAGYPETQRLVRVSVAA